MGMLDDIKKGMASTTGNKIEESSIGKGSRQNDSTSDAPIIPSLFAGLGALYLNMAIQFSDIDPDIIATNDKLAQEGLRPNERYVYFEAADYLAKNFGYIFAALCSDYKQFRSFIFDAVNLEVDLDKFSSEKRVEKRREMNMTPVFKTTEYGMYIGITNFSNYVCAGFEEAADLSFNKIKGSKMESDVDASVRSFGNDDRKILGIIFSEYIYFVRAFNHNAKFASEFISRINEYKKAYGF